MRKEMDSYALRTLLLGIFVVISSHSALSQCVDQTPCRCMREDGMGYDLTSLKDQNFTVDGSKNFRFQPCKNADLTFGGPNYNVSECNSTSICMLNTQNESINLGEIWEGVWELSNEIHLVFHHLASDKKTTHETRINLLCCHSCVRSTLEVDSSSETKHNLIFTSRNNCLTRLKAKGLSTGSVLVIILGVFSAVYFIGGAAALKIFRGAVGLELIPNYDFWSDLPGLVRDGVTFTLSGCTVVSYERI